MGDAEQVQIPAPVAEHWGQNEASLIGSYYEEFFATPLKITQSSDYRIRNEAVKALGDLGLSFSLQPQTIFRFTI